jgi:adenine phosphoribosyltransferase
MDEIEALVRHVPDFPRPGVGFKDITPLLADPAGFARCIDLLAQPWRALGVDVVCGIESRGFIFGAALAHSLGAGFVPLRKAGKLPPLTVGVDYVLEYGMDRLEARIDALRPGQHALIVDDVLATGGTLEAGRRLVEHLGAVVIGGSVVIELSALEGRARWRGDCPLHTLLKY